MCREEKKRRERSTLFPDGIYKLCILGAIAVVVVFTGLLTGCSIKETGGTKISDIEYAIVEDAGVPEELAAMIEEKKAADFKLTYEMDGALYIVRGYGEQATGGYSICVQDCYLTSNAVLFDTELVGPRKGESASASPSYPYIVIKMDRCDESIIFE